MRICRLCGHERELQDSHLIPKAYVRRFHRTSPTGAGRLATNPNNRTQEYLHKPLLCRECEQRFARRETVWGKEIDSKADGPLPRAFTCTEDHRYFAASLIWRIIAWDMKESADSPFTPDERATIRKSEADLRAYLLGEALYPDPP